MNNGPVVWWVLNHTMAPPGALLHSTQNNTNEPWVACQWTSRAVWSCWWRYISRWQRACPCGSGRTTLCRGWCWRRSTQKHCLQTADRRTGCRRSLVSRRSNGWRRSAWRIRRRRASRSYAGTPRCRRTWVRVDRNTSITISSIELRVVCILLKR